MIDIKRESEGDNEETNCECIGNEGTYWSSDEKIFRCAKCDKPVEFKEGEDNGETGDKKTIETKS